MSPPIIPLTLPPQQLLLVDDDPVTLETLSHLLNDEGFSVTTAASGEEAEHILRAAEPPFELVLTDLVMPGKSGMDVLKQALAVNATTTVLVLTGFGSVREATEAMDLGAYGMITKPVHLDQFRNILRRLLERIGLVHERNELRAQVQVLQNQVEELEATKGRMEMLAHKIGAASASAVAPSTPLSDLERLADLRERGLLTKEQFETAKRALLNRWLP